MGVGSERFYDEEISEYRSLPCVYFPMYSPLTEKQMKKRAVDIKKKLKAESKLRERKVLVEAYMAVEGAEKAEEEIFGDDELI